MEDVKIITASYADSIYQHKIEMIIDFTKELFHLKIYVDEKQVYHHTNLLKSFMPLIYVYNSKCILPKI